MTAIDEDTMDTISDVSRIFGTPSIIQKCNIDEAKGNISASLREILRNAYECHRHRVDEVRNIQPFHYNSLEFVCNSDMCIYVDSHSNKFKIGCLVCNKGALCHDADGYESIKEALVDAVKRVGLVHRIAHSAVSWNGGEIDEGDQTLGGTPYRLHLHHLTESNILGVVPCLPDRMKLDSCLGMDQLIVSAIENERCNESYIEDIVACWAGICNTYFIDEGVDEHLRLFETNFLYTVEHGVASAKNKFLHKMRQRDLILMDTGVEWKSEDKLQDCHLIGNAMLMMQIDWKFSKFPRIVPDDCQVLSVEDRSILNKELASKKDGMEFLHQLGILVEYLKHAPEKSTYASLYRQLPCVSYRYAFERGNLCKDIFTQAGRQERLPSSKMYVVKSFFNNWNENTQEFIKSIADDESFHIVARTRLKEKHKGSNVDVLAEMMGSTDNDQESSSDIATVDIDWADAENSAEIIGVEVDWVLSDELENQIHDFAHQKEIQKMKHGEWRTMSKKLKNALSQYSKGVLTKYQPISFSVKSLHPYQATVMLQDLKTANEWFGFAKTQIVLSNSFYHGSIHHQRAMEIMTNSSFQKPFIHQKVGVKRKHLKKVISSSIDVKWKNGCAIPKVGCPEGINDLLTLPNRVETDQWNCFHGNVRNLLAVLGQLDDKLDKELFKLTQIGDFGCMKGDIVQELCVVFQAAGYHTFVLPREMDFEKLSYYTHLMKLPILVSVQMSFNENATKYRHVIGICPYMSSSDCSELKISIVDGAHPELKAMQFTRDNIRWCCGDDTQSTFEGFAFFPGKRLSKRLLHQVGQGLRNGSRISVCWGKMSQFQSIMKKFACRT